VKRDREPARQQLPAARSRHIDPLRHLDVARPLELVVHAPRDARKVPLDAVGKHRRADGHHGARLVAGLLHHVALATHKRVRLAGHIQASLRLESHDHVGARALVKRCQLILAVGDERAVAIAV
jgi:hypothetical protein